MRNPYYVQEIIKKLIEYNNNKEIKGITEEYYHGKQTTWIDLFETKYYPNFKIKMQNIIPKRNSVDFSDLITSIEQEYF